MGALPPYLPRGFYSPFSITYRENTHNREKRDRRTHHITHHATLTQHDTTPLPANPANPKTWYGEGIERVRSGAISHPSGFFLDEVVNPARNPETTKNPQNQPENATKRLLYGSKLTNLGEIPTICPKIAKISENVLS